MMLEVYLLGLAAIAAVILAALVYPGELSHFSGAAHRWLYDRASRRYESKWSSPAYASQRYRDPLVAHAVCCIPETETGAAEVLDLGCGTGHGTRLLASALRNEVNYTCVDFSPGMLEQFSDWLQEQDDAFKRQVSIEQADISDWLSSNKGRFFDLVLLLEVGEFLKGFDRLIGQLGKATNPGGGLVLTRPAGVTGLFFPWRYQSRPALRRLLAASGYTSIHFLPWRKRYELVFARKSQNH
jgi:SAM-dependent methyltransferase